MSRPLEIPNGRLAFLFALSLAGCMLAGGPFLLFACADDTIRSHPPLRVAPKFPARSLPTGKSWFVDPARGNDAATGTEKEPWKSLQHAARQLHAGDTLLLRGGVYFENVYLALEGRADAPITIRGYPGENAILDGGLRDFSEDPAAAWEPAPNGAVDEFRSTRSYPNLRNVLGSFGDSQVGLQTYFYPQDLRAAGESVDWEDWDRTAETDIKPLWCGPGLWYDRSTGRIHVRLSHTHLPAPTPNYAGETDPRKLPLIVVPFHAKPLHLDESRHVRLQDLTIRGGGYETVRLDQCVGVEFDHVVVWCGTYGLTIEGTTGLKFLHSALYGNVAPWTFRGDGSKRDYPGRPHRNISRLNTHSLIEIGSGLESSVYATPQNDLWEFAWSEFAEAHDGVYLGGINVSFHHNLLEHFQDDGIYLSPMYLRHRLDKRDPEVRVSENVFRGVLTALAFGGPEGMTNDRVFIHRNIFDLRMPINTGRPSTRTPQPTFSSGKLIGDHGSPPWSSMMMTHNTVVANENSRDAAMNAVGSNNAKKPRRAFNNLFIHLGRLPGLVPPDSSLDAASDANLYWSPSAESKALATLFDRYRKSPGYADSRKLYEPGSESNSLAVDPKLVRCESDPAITNDYRLQPGSPAVNAGVPLPAGVSDATSSADPDKPDLGAIPLGADPFRVGINGRYASTGK